MTTYYDIVDFLNSTEKTMRSFEITEALKNPEASSY
jgi:hypothetical protein